jgi:hypothetical protein
VAIPNKKTFKTRERDGLPFMYMHVQVEKDMEGKEHPKPNRKNDHFASGRNLP